eukprot:930284-Pyramimonas_sp.AAC.1
MTSEHVSPQTSTSSNPGRHVRTRPERTVYPGRNRPRLSYCEPVGPSVFQGPRPFQGRQRRGKFLGDLGRHEHVLEGPPHPELRVRTRFFRIDPGILRAAARAPGSPIWPRFYDTPTDMTDVNPK